MRTFFSGLFLSLLLSCLICTSSGCGGGTSNIDCIDHDNDGYGEGLDCQGPDCNDGRGDIYPGATETCNNEDDDCDGLTDEDDVCPPCADEDGDGYGVGAGCLGPDCRDREPTCHEGACCEDPLDCTDLDEDGYGTGSECAGPDCNDDDSSCHAGMCCPGDCTDNDGDGRGQGADCQGPDCNDNDDLCWDGACCPTNCADNDSDGYGVGSDCLGDDCDDSLPAVHPGATEICNTIDDDCDDSTDEDGVCPDCIDNDGDLHGLYCEAGPDCDDNDINCYEGGCCPSIDALLEIYVLDIWAQPLPQSEANLSITLNSNEVDRSGYPIVSVPLSQAGSYEVGLSAPEHVDLSLTVEYDGSDTLSGVTLTTGAGAYRQGLALSHEMRNVNGTDIPVHSLYLGLRHKWFSAQGRPARRGNDIDLMINGEEAWAQIYYELLAASESVLVSSWWWMSDFELVRNWATHAYLTPEERWDNTIMGAFEINWVHVRVLIGEFWGDHDIMDWLTTDDALKGYAETSGDDFEFMGQGNPTYGEFQVELTPFLFGQRVRDTHSETAARTFDSEDEIPSTILPYWADLTDWPFIDIEIQIASWHQKFLVIDHDLAYIGGMNVKTTDWDSQDHLVFDHRRMNFDATVEEREEVINKERETDLGPRRDYILRIKGPAAQDAADVFQKRWSQAIADEVSFAENSTDFVVQRAIDPLPNGSQVQVTATMPEPFWEHAIAETWFNAVAQAEDFIFIEDQYWRIPWLVDAIAERMRQAPNLKLLVITKPVDEWLDPGCEWTAITHHQLLDEFGANRYRTYQLTTFDSVVTWGWDETESRYANIDTHSKMLIVDDKFMSIGSCNKNNRGIIYEGELNGAVLDPDFVRAQRRRIFANLLPSGTPATDNTATWWQQFVDAAAWNDSVYEAWDDEGWDIDNGDGSGPLPAEYQPAGFVHTLEFRVSDYCFFEGVGPDMTAWTPSEIWRKSISDIPISK
jgi:putative metal-binding protein/phospholipase D-like protein